MKKLNWTIELSCLALIAIPYIYLWMVWDQLAAQVPIHFNIRGEADNWTARENMLWIPLAICGGLYFIYTIIPYIDPKKKVEQMGNKFHHLKLILMAFMSALCCLIIYSGIEGNFPGSQPILLILATLFIVLGNYFQSIKPNYFLGIRTPWALESDQNWRKTHRMAGRLWILGGLLIGASTFIIPESNWRVFFSLATVTATSVFPFFYSWWIFRSEKALNGV